MHFTEHTGRNHDQIMAYQPRWYRDRMQPSGLIGFRVVEKETDLMIYALRDLTDQAKQSVSYYRSILQNHNEDRFFASLEPIEAKPSMHPFLVHMIEASQKAVVGPMACVAGAIAQYVGISLMRYSSELIIENGGDLFIATSCERKIGIYAGSSPLSNQLALRINPESTPNGICASSGTFGHSTSFGKADAVVIMAKDALFADAMATAICNRVQTPDDITMALEIVKAYSEVQGACVIAGDRIGVWGSLDLIPIQFDNRTNCQ